MKFASVILDIPTAALETPYTYVVLETAEEQAQLAAAKSSAKMPAKKAMQASFDDLLAEDPIQASPSHLSTADLMQAGHEVGVKGLSVEKRSAANAPQPFSEEKTTNFCAPSLGSSVQVGCAVLVPFGGRKAVGFVVGLNAEAPSSLDFSKLKAVEEVLGKPCFTEIGAQCAQFLADRYLAPFSSCIRLFMPPGGVPRMERINGTWQVTRPMVSEVDERWVTRTSGADEFKPRKGAVKQELVLQALKQGDLRVAELTAEYGSVSATLKSLEKKGVIRIEHRRRMRECDQPSAAFSKRAGERPVLTPHQEEALAAIAWASAKQDGHVVLVDGVTGSGKTEVYLRAIENELEQGRGAIVLVPEISLTPQTVARFRGRFGDTVAVLHSRMSQGERFDQWDLIREGRTRVVVGARSALFAPMENVGIVIIDEEHESSYKQDQAPRYVTRDVAEWMVRWCSVLRRHRSRRCIDVRWSLRGLALRCLVAPTENRCRISMW